MDTIINYGIDLGTTNSCIARCEAQDVRVFQNNDQMNVTPSVIRILKNGRIIVGKRAYNEVADADNVAAEFKRLMGQSAKKTFAASGRIMSPEELSAEVLKSLREDVRRQTGDEIEAAVITVPAAFGTLQCEATARAALAAGFRQSPLLQEPIAAAIAYGAVPGAADQRWLIFDLGGGTLDIAIVSTGDGRLTVLEHQGNNFCGGKDIDRKIAEVFFVPPLTDWLPNRDREPGRYELLIRRLTRKAEEAKIELSQATQVIVDFSDIKGADGEPIEREFTLTRAQLEKEIEPFVEECLKLAETALNRAKIKGPDLDRVLLVGGPTQMPIVRRALAERLGTKIDFSLDPMTVVARGAALFASTVETSSGAPNRSSCQSEKTAVELVFDRLAILPETSVMGRIIAAVESSPVSEIQIEAEGGFWVSGWAPLDKDGAFQLNVVSQEDKQSTCFKLTARDRSGKSIQLEPSEFTIRRGLTVGAPPLPHSIGIELVQSDGRGWVDQVFSKGTPLPAKKTVKYRANRTLRPNEPDESINIKLWEGEEKADPAANDWIGYVKLWSNWIKRPLPEGAEIELTLRIDASRTISVEVFVPHLNEHFADREFYIAKSEERDPVTEIRELPKQMNTDYERLEQIKARLREIDDTRLDTQFQRLTDQVNEVYEEAVRASQNSADADQAARAVHNSKKLRGELAAMERASGIGRETPGRDDPAAVIKATEDLVNQLGSDEQKKEFALVRRELEKAIQRDDQRGQRKSMCDMQAIGWRILSAQEVFWRDAFDYLRSQGQKFTEDDQADEWLRRGAAAYQAQNTTKLREAVQKLWQLQTPNVVEAQQQQAVLAGLKKH
jgi:molecular chaperone DnaK